MYDKIHYKLKKKKKNPSANAGDMGPFPVQVDPTFWGLTKVMYHDSIEPMR